MESPRSPSDGGLITCPICLDLLKVPVTTPCGHSFCLGCLERYWDTSRDVCKCPQCRETFTPRPRLKKNCLLAELVDERKSKRRHASAYAGPDDVACDLCVKRKMKAQKSCLVCLVSYCDEHLQPHLEGPAFKRHKLVAPSKELQDSICAHHDDVMKLYCCVDQQGICSVCAVHQHKGHDMVSTEAARVEREKEVDRRRTRLQQSIQSKEKDLKLYEQQVASINLSADKALDVCQQIFGKMISLLQKRQSSVEQKITSQWEGDLAHVLGLCEQLEQQIMELKKEDAELEKLSQIDSHIQFLQNFSSHSSVPEETFSSANGIEPHCYLQEVAAAVSVCRCQLQDYQRDSWTNFCSTLTPEEHFQMVAEPQTRAQFLRYLRDITLDPNTAESKLQLSDGNRRVTKMEEDQFHPDHPDRFTTYSQVLSKETLTGRCYWEVEWSGGGIYAAVAYKSIIREGEESGFGDNIESWSLYSDNVSCIFRHGKVTTTISEYPSNKLGVFLDHSAGLLSFYRVSETMTVLHQVRTRFTEPLHAGVLLGHRTTCEFLDLN
ncbi:tripartite motif-containing protein 16-like [Synchiropus splendidus]|uniref:tripartite motif-containing protein 16-like n=1 Tax=Synchiropus splendidus TaxID=270530 RepID=UPI00237E8117|nr:tripartite motif-containing protein 16-like [Synchiropus splendidus]